VANGVRKREAVELNEQYFTYHELNRPFIIAKTAQTLDGKIATLSGESKWITGAEARKRAHALRRDVDAVLVGAGTVKKDDPQLTVRHVKGDDPYRIILSANLSFDMSCRLVEENYDYKTIVATSAASARKLARRKLVRTPIIWSLKTQKSGLIDPLDFIQRATDFGLRSILIEGGSHVIGSFLNAALVDKLVVFTAPKVLGGGLDAIPDLGIRKLDRAIQLSRTHVDTAGDDIVISGYPVVEK
jgi:diaminohydroxyphosphoribosylaminopyrimidine deaminase/5-amino-6-(5-phosphoribosylamino)uracil reductase